MDIPVPTSMSPSDIERHIDALRRFYEGGKARLRIGPSDRAHVFSARSIFLDAINECAPEVIDDLRDSVVPTHRTFAGDEEPFFDFTWGLVSNDNHFAPLKRALEGWAKRWGMPLASWSKRLDEHWLFTAALRLLAKWQRGESTSELTLPTPLEVPDVAVASEDEVIYVYKGFALLVFDHVLELRPWVMKAPPEDGEPRTQRWVGDMASEDINKRVRESAKRI
jgi:hypothetical protein